LSEVTIRPTTIPAERRGFFFTMGLSPGGNKDDYDTFDFPSKRALFFINGKNQLKLS
jgi:hypothetical protein